MGLENGIKVLTNPKYLGIFGVVAVFVGWLYIVLLTDQSKYDAVGWSFAIL